MEPADHDTVSFPDRRTKEGRNHPPPTKEQLRKRHRAYEAAYRERRKAEISARWRTPEFRAKRRAKYAANREAIREYDMERFARYWSNPEWSERQLRLARERYAFKKQNQEWMAKRRAMHREQYARRMRNPETVEHRREADRRYWRRRYDTDPEFRERGLIEHRNRHRSRYRTLLESLLDSQDWRCGHPTKGGVWKSCGRDLRDVKQAKIHVDHIIPVTRGGGDEYENLQALCERCNIQAQNRMRPANAPIVRVRLLSAASAAH